MYKALCFCVLNENTEVIEILEAPNFKVLFEAVKYRMRSENLYKGGFALIKTPLYNYILDDKGKVINRKYIAFPFDFRS